MSEDLHELKEAEGLKAGAVFTATGGRKVSKVRYTVAEQVKKLSATIESAAYRLRQGGIGSFDDTLEDLRSARIQIRSLIELVAALRDDEKEAAKLNG